jgi:hypothetical protein
MQGLVDRGSTPLQYRNLYYKSPSGNRKNTEANMKINALIIAFLMALAGCSASVHGDVQGSNTPENAKNGVNIVSNTGTNHSGVSVVR